MPIIDLNKKIVLLKKHYNTGLDTVDSFKDKLKALYPNATIVTESSEVPDVCFYIHEMDASRNEFGVGQKEYVSLRVDRKILHVYYVCAGEVSGVDADIWKVIEKDPTYQTIHVKKDMSDLAQKAGITPSAPPSIPTPKAAPTRAPQQVPTKIPSMTKQPVASPAPQPSTQNRLVCIMQSSSNPDPALEIGLKNTLQAQFPHLTIRRQSEMPQGEQPGLTLCVREAIDNQPQQKPGALTADIDSAIKSNRPFIMVGNPVLSELAEWNAARENPAYKNHLFQATQYTDPQTHRLMLSPDSLTGLFQVIDNVFAPPKKPGAPPTVKTQTTAPASTQTIASKTFEEKLARVKDPNKIELIRMLKKHKDAKEKELDPNASGTLDFKIGFRHHINSRSMNREGNLALTDYLIDELFKDNSEIATLFDEKNLRQKKHEFMLAKRFNQHPDYVERSVHNSQGLHEAIKRAHAMTKPAHRHR